MMAALKLSCSAHTLTTSAANCAPLNALTGRNKKLILQKK
jgi:hypothetical protein